MYVLMHTHTHTHTHVYMYTHRGKRCLLKFWQIQKYDDLEINSQSAVASLGSLEDGSKSLPNYKNQKIIS